jgi:hypothetical protein
VSGKVLRFYGPFLSSETGIDYYFLLIIDAKINGHKMVTARCPNI